MNRRGAFSISMHETQWPLIILFIIVVAFGVLFFVNSQVKRQINIADVELQVLNSRFLFGDCFIYDGGFRKYEGVIDISKFTEENLRRCVVREGYYVKLTLEIEDEKMEIYNDEDKFKRINPLCKKIKNYYCSEEKAVIIDSEFRKGSLNVEGILESA